MIFSPSKSVGVQRTSARPAVAEPVSSATGDEMHRLIVRSDPEIRCIGSKESCRIIVREAHFDLRLPADMITVGSLIPVERDLKGRTKSIRLDNVQGPDGIIALTLFGQAVLRIDLEHEGMVPTFTACVVSE